MSSSLLNPRIYTMSHNNCHFIPLPPRMDYMPHPLTFWINSYNSTAVTACEPLPVRCRSFAISLTVSW